jgi:hypothetical protein
MNGLYQDTMLARCLAEAKYRIGEEAHRSHQSWVRSPIFNSKEKATSDDKRILDFGEG